jgi:hypothetical protein
VRDPVARATEALAAGSSRRGFLARAGALLLGTAAGGAARSVLTPDEAAAHHFCGHLYTTDSCPHPTGLPRIDAHGYPLRARDGARIDDLGRRIDREGAPVDDDGRPLTDPDGRALPVAPRTRVCARTGETHGFRPHLDGTWHRCCGGHVRKLVDCCGYVHNRVNGDAALTGYCYSGRKVFCVMYYDTKVPC